MVFLVKLVVTGIVPALDNAFKSCFYNIFGNILSHYWRIGTLPIVSYDRNNNFFKVASCAK